jgi:hypothetical protein
MFHRSSTVLAKVCWGGVLLALLGCSRSAVVMAPEGASHADESDAPAAARGKADEQVGTPFAFPEDASGVLLAKVLPPKEPEMSRPDHAAPPSHPSASLQMKPPALPLPPSHAAMPRLPAAIKPVPLRPRLVLDETPDGLLNSPVLPELPSLPDGGRVHVPSVDVNQPIPLPVLAQPVSDRASLDDPTAAASVTAALAALVPSRTAKAPFLKRTLPDPYDHRRSQKTAVPEEQTEPPLGTPQTPSQPATSRP